MKNSWSNVSGELAIELYANDGEAVDTIFDASDDKEIPEITPDMVLDISRSRHCIGGTGIASRCYEYELVIDFVSSGYYDSGRTSGPPENCYPPEGDEDREPVRAYLMRYEVTGGGARLATKIELSSEKMNALFNHFKDKIDEVELEEEMM